MGRADTSSYQLVRGNEISGQKIVVIPVLSVRLGESPRLKGVDKAHIARLAEVEGPLPPILIERRSMCVIDGAHRLMAASLKGQETIDAEFFDGSAADAFLQAVEANVMHGLPLTKDDRRAAAARIIRSHPQFSDRAIARLVGMATRTVAAIRRSAGSVQMGTRVGRDGKVRPVDGKEGRLRAAAIMADNPGASLREVARSAGVSPATARDVRKRLEQGKEPVASEPRANDNTGVAIRKPQPLTPLGTLRSTAGVQVTQEALLRRLLQDPSLRHNEQGRRLLRLLHAQVIGARELHDLASALPPHRVATVVQMAGQCAEMWLDFARELTERLRVIDPGSEWTALMDGVRTPAPAWRLPLCGCPAS